MHPDRQRLRDLVDARCLSFGPTFTLTTGAKSNFYFDCKKATLHGECLSLITRVFLDAIAALPTQPEAIGGLTMGADFIVAGVIQKAHEVGHPIAEGAIVRQEKKTHGTMNTIENAPPAGTKIVVVDDVVTSGRSTRIAAEEFEKAGYDIVGIINLVDREAGGMDALRSRFNCPVLAILEKKDFPRLSDGAVQGTPEQAAVSA